MKRLLTLIALLLTVASAAASEPAEPAQPAQSVGPAEPGLYRVLTIRAAPGELSAWLERCRDIRAAYVKRGDPAPFILRHTQGDQWDFLLIEPWGSFEEYLAPERMARRQAAAEEMALLRLWLDDAPAFREDLFALGPPMAKLEKLFATAGFAHVEMFYALPYKKADLIEQRRMENDYLARTGQPTNTIWVGISGSDVDVFTIGFYADLPAFAAGSPRTDEEKDAAARAAGFDGVDQIAPYLRTLISKHRDTFAVPVD